jgi:hypothetical protein
MLQRGPSKPPFAADAQGAAFLRFADPHLELHKGRTTTVATNLIWTDGLTTSPSVRMFMEVSNVQPQVMVGSGSFDKILVGAQSTKCPNYV